jgi:cytochrome c-type biogenesis protein
MDFLISFLEGIITFISPCLLPMIPIYLSFFAGEATQNKKMRTVVNACGFVLGFTVIFVLMGAFAGTLGKLLKEYSVIVNVIMGILLILFGLSFMEVIKLPSIGGTKRLQFRTTQLSLFRSILFGIVFSLGWTPCVSAFLGCTDACSLTGRKFEGHSHAAQLFSWAWDSVYRQRCFN